MLLYKFIFNNNAENWKLELWYSNMNPFIKFSYNNTIEASLYYYTIEVYIIIILYKEDYNHTVSTIKVYIIILL